MHSRRDGKYDKIKRVSYFELLIRAPANVSGGCSLIRMRNLHYTLSLGKSNTSTILLITRTKELQRILSFV